MLTVLEKITEDAKLISLPEVYLRLKEVLDDPDFSMMDVANVISNDPGVTARLLNLANSAYFGLAAKIDTVSRAINMLGTQQVHDLVLAASVSRAFEGMSNQVMDMDQYWRKSVSCAIASHALAMRSDVLDSERVFVAGLLRDIGHLVMYQSIPVASMEAMAQAKKLAVPIHKVEQVIMGTDYAKVGGVLMRQWNLPKSLWEPAEFHIEPGAAEGYELITGLVHIASLMTEASLEGTDVQLAIGKVSPDAWKATWLEPEKCDGIMEEVEQQLATVMDLIFPSAKPAMA